MIRVANFLVLAVACVTLGHGQVPPGHPYDPSAHPNPIVTYVNSDQFQSYDFTDAQETAGLELLGLSRSEGHLTSIELADASVQRVRILGRNVQVTFYPVVRQTFELTGGGEFLIYSFKNPRSPAPPEVLEQAAFAQTRRASDSRFGTASAPERLRIRGSDGLLFEMDDQITVFWQENGVNHTATAALPREELFRVIEDLL